MIKLLTVYIFQERVKNQAHKMFETTILLKNCIRLTKVYEEGSRPKFPDIDKQVKQEESEVRHATY